MKKLGKILLWLMLTVLVLLILGGAAAGVKYYLVTHSGAQAELLSGPERTEPVVLGVKYQVAAQFRLPWGIRPVSVSAAPAGSCPFSAAFAYACASRAATLSFAAWIMFDMSVSPSNSLILQWIA